MIMEEALLISSLSKKQLYLINLVYIKFWVIFISKLLEYGNNRTKGYYLKGYRD